MQSRRSPALYKSRELPDWGSALSPRASQSRYRARDHLQVIAEPSRTLYRTAVSVCGVVTIKVIRVSDLSQSWTLGSDSDAESPIHP